MSDATTAAATLSIPTESISATASGANTPVVTSTRDKTSAEHIFAFRDDDDDPIGDKTTIQIDSGTAAVYGLPEREFTGTVVGRFEKNEIDSSGYFVSIKSEDLSDEELVFAHKRGIFQKPSHVEGSLTTAGENKEHVVEEELKIATIPWETNVEAGVGTLRLFVTSSQVTEDTIDRVKDLISKGLATYQEAGDEAWNIVVETHTSARKNWLPIDYAHYLSSSYANDAQTYKENKVCLEIFILLDEKTAEDAEKKREKISVNVIYQLTQLPERRDPMRAARWEAGSIGRTLGAIVVGSFKFEDAYETDPDVPVYLEE